jgi:FlaA1/EpsC-like NDP-sugar epimerase
MTKKYLYFFNFIKILIIWSIATIFAFLLRFEFYLSNDTNKIIIPTILSLVLVFYLITYVDLKVFGKSSSLTFEEFFSTLRRFITSGLIVFTAVYIFPEYLIPRSIPILTSILAVGFQLLSNKLLKIYLQKYRFHVRKIPVAIYGGGIQGQILINKILKDTSLDWKPIFIFDDFMETSITKINGVKVLARQNLEIILLRYKPKILIISFSKLSNQKLQDIQLSCDRSGVQLLLIPPIRAITGKEFVLSDLRNPTQEELIGKSSIKFESKSVKNLVSDKTILVTGAGGSIGSELARQISAYSPKELFLLDRDESGLLDVNLSLSPQGSLKQDNLLLADIRDSDRIKEIFSVIKPNIVFHAAALKHLSMLEKHPDEAIKTNINGTKNVLRESLNSGVEVFINISTDKAADPISVLGKTKLFGEKLTASYGYIQSQSRFISVRFGNVFGSKGSVLHTFNKQISMGGPLTLTTKGVTRFFMTVEEAVHLLLRATTQGNNGDTLILKMGNPILIEDIASKLIKGSGKNIEVVYSGLRKGEKLHEVLVGKNERILPSTDSEIITVRVEPISIESDFYL